MMELLRRLRDFFRRDRLAEELEQELRFHRERLARDERAHGLSAADADRAARVRLGNATNIREDSRSMWSFTWIEQLAQDLQYAARSLRRNITFTVVATLTLALGIGANTAIFTVVNSVVFRPLAYKDPDQLVVLWERTAELPRIMISYPNFRDWTGRLTAFDDAALYSPYSQFTLTGMGDAVRIRGGLATGNLFDVLGVRAALGRTLTTADDRVGVERVVLLTHAFWQNRFGGDSGAVNTLMTIDGHTYRVIGVLPPRVRLAGSEFWLPIGLFENEERFTSRENHPGTIGIGRLKQGVTLAQMQADLDGLYAGLRAEHPQPNAGIMASGMGLTEFIVGDVRGSLFTMAGAVGLVLLIACANVANLLIGRAASRQREIALRMAIGARRGRIVRQLLTESTLLSAIGGALGLVLAWGGVRALLALQPANLPRLSEIQIDIRVLAFAAAASLLTGLIFGLLPALHTAKGDLVNSLRDGGRGATAGRARLRMRSVLMSAEVSLALVLLVGAGLLVRSFANLMRVDTGVDSRGVVTAFVSLPTSRYPDSVQRQVVFDDLLMRSRAIPEVTLAGSASDLPVTTNWQTGVAFEGMPAATPGSEPLLNATNVDAAWFSTMGMRVVEGRGIGVSDRTESAPVAVLSEEVARRFYPNMSPVGRRMKLGPLDSDRPWVTIVGIVNDVRDNGLSIASRGTVYLPITQSASPSRWIGVRTSGDPARVIPALRKVLADIDPNIPLASVLTLETRVSAALAPWRFAMLMLGLFAAIALVLAVIGIYGVISYAVALRTHEIGVRVALGAQSRDVVRLVGRQALAVTGVGIAIGSVVALIAGRVLTNLLYGVEPTDPVTFVAVAVVLAGAAVVAAAIPAWRASRLDPVLALRAE
jgi:putative ABC transport system permease protein